MMFKPEWGLLLLLLFTGLGILYFDHTKPVPLAPSCPTVSSPIEIRESSERSVKWIIPEDTKKIYVRILEKNGTLIREIDVTPFIKIVPGNKLQVLAK